MAVARITAIEIHDARLFAPKGIVYNWARGVTREVKEAAQGFAPPSRSRARWGTRATGKLKRSISGRVEKRGPKVLDMIIEAKAPYAKWVHGGTGRNGTRFIYSTLGAANKAFIAEILRGNESFIGEDLSGLYMKLPPPGPKYVLRVRGQRANPFLVDGFNLVSKKHRSLKPVRPKFRY